MWPVIYLLLLVHTTPRFWIWMFFPAIFVAVDRILLTQRQRYPAVLSSARLLLFDVIHLTFEIPENFTYQAASRSLLRPFCKAGQYVRALSEVSSALTNLINYNYNFKI